MILGTGQCLHPQSVFVRRLVLLQHHTRLVPRLAVLRAMRSSSSLSFSFSSLLQYALLGVVAYVLIGAPLLSLVNFSGSEYSHSTNTAVGSVGDTLDSLVIPEANLSCEEHSYKGVYVMNREPLVVYIEGFLSEDESEGVVRVR